MSFLNPELPENKPAWEVPMEYTEMKKQISDLKSKLDAQVKENGELREALKECEIALSHCKNRPHEHNPPDTFVMTHCEVIDRALSKIQGAGK